MGRGLEFGPELLEGFGQQKWLGGWECVLSRAKSMRQGHRSRCEGNSSTMGNIL